MKKIWIVFLVAPCFAIVIGRGGNFKRPNQWAQANVFNYFFREKCMEDLGCFSNGPPFFNFMERPISLLPQDREKIGTKFTLFTRSSPNEGTTFVNGNFTPQDIRQAGFKPTANTKFIVPGFISRYAINWKMPLKDALLHNERCNVFYVDWSGGDGPLYEQAVANTRVVGAEIAHFIKYLQDTTGLKPETVHLIGHSLGSHVSGYAGKRIKNLGRISGTDPAGPYFINVDPSVRLDRDDAIFVDVIHTNAASNRFLGFGTTESLGHFDFYPNGGHLQPGCKSTGEAVLSFLFHPKFGSESISELACSHMRSVTLFISSMMNPKCKLQGIQVDTLPSYPDFQITNSIRSANFVTMGMDSIYYAPLQVQDRSLLFFLNTTEVEPFCIQN